MQWARDAFEGTFTQAPLSALQYITESDFVEKTMKLQGAEPVETLEKVKRVLVDECPKSFEDCVAWARKLFQDLFHNSIAQLLHNFPPDQQTSSGTLISRKNDLVHVLTKILISILLGQPFWSGPKRCPKVLNFDPNIDLHLDFVLAAANLLAAVYGIEGSRNRDSIVEMGKIIDS